MTKLFANITKVDPDKRLVEGYASTEAEDSQGEVVSRGAIEGALEGYMKFGNVREMHQSSAVGKTKLAVMDEKGLKISVKVVDDAAWKKVREGVYNGFSIGGNATRKNGNIIEAMDLTEISLVDRPACPEALFTLWKAEGNPTMKKSKADVSAALQTVAQVSLAKACGLSNVSQLAATIESLNWVINDSEWERQYEGDQSTVPAMLRAGYSQLAEALKVMAAEETAEAAAEQAKQAGEADPAAVVVDGEGADEVALADKAKVKKTEVEETEEEKRKAAEAAAAEEEAAKKKAEGEEGSDDEEEEEGSVDDAAAASEEGKDEGAREYSDEEKVHLKAVYRMLKESGVLDEVAAEEEKRKADEAAAAEEDASKVDGEETEEEKAKKAEAAAAEEEAAKKKAEGQDDDTAKADDEDVGKVAKALGLKSDAQLLKAAGFSSAAEALKTIGEAAKIIKAQKSAIDELRAMPTLTKGVLRVVGRDGSSDELTADALIAKGEKPSDVLAKVLAGEIGTSPVSKYFRAD